MAMGIDEHLGGGMHLNLSVQRDGANAFFDEVDEGNRSELMRRWLAGMLATLPGSMSLLTPNVNSYRRLVELTGPPMTVTWGEDNKSAALRTVTRDPATARIEHRVPSADCNIYLALASAARRRADRDRGRARAAARARGDGVDAAARRRSRGCRTRSSAPPPPWRPTGGWPRRSGATWSTYWLGSREWEWLAFHTGGGDPDQVSEYELRRYFETA